MPNKLRSQSNLFRIIQNLKRRGKKIVFARGCFDLLHPGHLYYLKKAKELGDRLVVWLNTDQSIRKRKGRKRPLFNQKERGEMLAELEVVDFICLFNDQDGLVIIQKFKPDIVVVDKISPDYQKVIKAYRGKIVIIPLLKKYSTSKIIKQILKIYVSQEKNSFNYRE